MLRSKAHQQSPSAPAKTELLSPLDVQAEYGIPTTTQAVWRCADRYEFRQLVIKLGSGVRYKRADLEAWLESRRQIIEGHAQASGRSGVA